MARFEFKTGGHGIVRFVYFLNYPEDVPVEDGEKWYFDKHVPEVRRLPGITSYRTWQALPPIPMGSPDPYDRFVRMSEVIFENMAAAQQATIESPRQWSAPASGDVGFGELECMFLPRPRIRSLTSTSSTTRCQSPRARIGTWATTCARVG